MLKVSERIAEAVKQPVKFVTGRVAVDKPNGETVVFRGSDAIQSLKLTQVGGYFLSAVRTGEINLIGVDFGVLAGLTCEVSAQVRISGYGEDEVYEDIPYGRFYITEQDVDLKKGTTTLEIEDTIAFMGRTAYLRGDFTYPATVAELIEQTANKFGLEIVGDISELPNSDMVVPAPDVELDQLELFEESAQTTYRDVLDQLAGLTACVARVNGNGLEFVKVNLENQATLTYDNLMSAEIGERWGDVNTVNLAREPQEDNIVYPEEYEGDRFELRLTNNAIVEYADDDDDTRRKQAVVPIYDAVVGLNWTATELKTEGHGFYEIGDRLKVINGDSGEEIETVLTEISLTIAGSLKETLISETPEPQNTDYSTAGSMSRTFYTVQMKTDKQAGEIRGLVQRTEELDGEIKTNYSEFVQTVTQIVQAVQKAGGTNLLKNSVGYDKDANGVIKNWEIVGGVSSATSPESISFGALSGNMIILPKGASIKQRVSVAVGTNYAISAIVRKPLVGSAVITLSNDSRTIEIGIDDQREYLWQRVGLPQTSDDPLTATQSYVDITVKNVSAEYLNITDLMFTQGDTMTNWQQSANEILNTQVALTENGITVRSSTYDGDYIEITPLGFTGYSSVGGSSQPIFWFSREVTNVVKLNATQEISLPPIKIIPTSMSGRTGWAFIKGSD